MRLLENISSTNIEKIEIMANPSVTFDASGNAGIINIVMNKQTIEGFNGSYTATISYGRLLNTIIRFHLIIKTPTC